MEAFTGFEPITTTIPMQCSTFDIPWLIVFFIITAFLPYKEMTFLGEINQLLSVSVLA